MRKRIKKSFFREPTAAQIKGYNSVREISSNLIQNILDLNEDEAVIIKTCLIPQEHPNARKFMKHEQEVKLRRFRSLEEAIAAKKTPVQLREQAFNNIKNRPYSGYSVKPFVGTDRRTRKFSLVEALEGAKIYCYTHQPETNLFTPSPIQVKPYADVTRVVRDGAEIEVRVPSRTKGQPRYKFSFISVPIIDNENKWGIAHNISTNHSCESKHYQIRYTRLQDRESSKLFKFCAHEDAGYKAIIDQYWTQDKNMIPLQMSQFAIPTQLAARFYDNVTHNCLIQTPDDKKPRKPNIAEKEILLWGLVSKLGHDSTFFATEKLRDYHWRK